MQLRVARLCLDCEEVHDSQQCPACASESFAYLSRWIPTPERRTRPRSSETDPSIDRERLEALRGLNKGQVLTGGVVGLTAISLLGWLWRRGTGTDAPGDAASPSSSPTIARARAVSAHESKRRGVRESVDR